MTDDNRGELAILWHQCAQIMRRDVFSDTDILRPKYDEPGGRIAAQMDIPAIGTVGRNYQEHGVSFVSVNPAGGKATSRSTESDDHLYDAFAGVRDANSPSAISDAFESMVSRFSVAVRGWTITRQYIDPILRELKVSFDDVCYLYLVPFRTLGDKGSTMPERFTLSAYEKHLKHQLSATRPALLIAVDRPSETYCRIWANDAAERSEVFYYTRKRDAHAERRQRLSELARFAKGRQ